MRRNATCNYDPQGIENVNVSASLCVHMYVEDLVPNAPRTQSPEALCYIAWIGQRLRENVGSSPSIGLIRLARRLISQSRWWLNRRDYGRARKGDCGEDA